MKSGTMFLLKKVDRLFGPLLLKGLHASSVHTKLARPSSILIVRPGGIGDATLLMPAINLLAESFPDAEITVLAEQRNAAVFARCPVLHQVYCYDRPSDLLRALNGAYDVVIDSEQWYCLSAVVARLVRADIRIGFATSGRGRVFTHPVAYSQEIYETSNFFQLLAPLGVTSPCCLDSPWLVPEQKALAAADSLLVTLTGTPFVAIFPGASVPEKCWGTRRFTAVAEHLAKRDIAVVVLGGRQESKAGAELAAAGQALDLTGRTSLPVAAAILARSALLVSGDSGLLHLAAAVGTPTVALFGPSSVEKWAPQGKLHRTLSARLPCAPCARYGTVPPCRLKVACLEAISVDEVAAAVMDLLHVVTGVFAEQNGKYPRILNKIIDNNQGY